MILLDTNVISELTRSVPDARVAQWIERHDVGDLWICAISVAEIRLGVELMPPGKRKSEVAEVTDRVLGVFKTCVAFDAIAAEDYASIVATRRRTGRPMEVEDGQIAAIAHSAGLTLATRNTKDFSNIDGLNVVDPWGHG